MLRFEGIGLRYPDGTVAVRELTAAVSRGESVALVGANGAGKSSLLLSAVGILEPFSGRIEVDGVAVTKKTARDVRRRVGLVFQNPDDQLFTAEVAEDIAFGLRNAGMRETEVSERVAATLKLLGIERLGKKSPLRLSGGEKRTAAIATVLAMEPSLLLFDEPTAFLDPRSRRSLIGLLNRLPQAKVIATHDLAFAEETCGRVIVLGNGELRADGGIGLLRDIGLMEACGLEALC